jgi:hypothetical protein
LVSKNSDTKNTCIGDSGASCHNYNNDLALFDVRDVSERIIVENGHIMKTTKIRSQRCNLEQVNGKTFQVVPQDFKFMPGV